MRQVVDLAAPQTSYLIITSGESGQAFNKHYDDQTSLWLNGGYIQLNTGWKTIEQESWDILNCGRNDA